MQLSIMDEKGQECQYTGNKAKYLINITNGETTSGWLCRDALEAALRMLNAMEGRVEVIDTVPVQAEEKKRGRPRKSESVAGNTDGEPTTERPSPRKSPGNDPRRKLLLESLQEDLQELADNPPPKTNGQPSESVSEKHIVSVLKRHIKRFPNPNEMYGPVETVFGIGGGADGKRRFELMLTKVRQGND
jgi:hypothetical protein